MTNIQYLYRRKLNQLLTTNDIRNIVNVLISSGFSLSNNLLYKYNRGIRFTNSDVYDLANCFSVNNTYINANQSVYGILNDIVETVWLLESSQFNTEIKPGATFILSTYKLNKYYAGPAIRIKRTSDGKEKDIYFAGYRLDFATINDFTQNGLIPITASVIYDQSGNNYHLFVQSTRNPALLYFDPYQRNYVFRFKTVTGNIGYENSTIPFDTRSLTIYTIARGRKAAAGQDMYWEAGNSALTYYKQDINNRRLFDSGSRPWTERDIKDTIDFNVHSVRSSGTGYSFNVDNLQSGTTGTPVNSTVSTGIRVGIWSAATPAADAKYDWGGIIGYNTVLTNTEDNANITAIHQRLGKTVQHSVLIVAVRDSLTESDTATNALMTDEGWLINLARQYPQTFRIVNSGYSGHTLDQMTSNIATRATNLIALGTYTKKICIVWGGTNNIPLGDDAAALATKLTTLVTAIKAGGFDQVVGIDLIPRTDFTAPQNVIKDAFNADLAINFGTYGINRLARLSQSNWQSSHRQADGIHLSPVGNIFTIPTIKQEVDQALL